MKSHKRVPKIKIYTGLSLSARQVHQILPQAIVGGPIARTDLHGDIDDGFNIVGIVDGKFMQSLAVSPSEIMDALRCGLRVYGSSSLGALRAVELRNCGMQGCGEIFEFIKANKYFRDDYLGQAFMSDPEHPERMRASVPFVDLKFAINQFVSNGRIPISCADEILDAYEELYFAERNWTRLQDSLQRRVPGRDWTKILKMVSRSMFSQKERDALQMLKMIRQDVSEIKKLNSKLNPSGLEL